ncbi:MAG: DUF2334 domain-containing protein [Terrimicrobiaceae bacterium]
MPSPEMQTRSLIVSLHDVSPLTAEISNSILQDLAGAGVRAVSLLIIPNHHHKAPVAGDPGFAALAARWISECGHEAVLHGYYHLRESRSADGLVTRAITSHYTAGEGEFFDLPYETARELLARGRNDLRACGLSPAGFIAPAWLLGREASKAVENEGFRYTTRLDRIEPFGRPAVRTQSLVWSVRAPWRRLCSLAWNAFLFRQLSAHPVLRIGLHPPDWKFPAIRSQILGLCRSALADRQFITYDKWVTCSATHQ